MIIRLVSVGGKKLILHFHSIHPLYMKKNVVREYVNNALKITADDHLVKAVFELKKTLRRSSYPESFYSEFISQFLNN